MPGPKISRYSSQVTLHITCDRSSSIHPFLEWCNSTLMLRAKPFPSHRRTSWGLNFVLSHVTTKPQRKRFQMEKEFDGHLSGLFSHRVHSLDLHVHSTLNNNSVFHPLPQKDTQGNKLILDIRLIFMTCCSEAQSDHNLCMFLHMGVNKFKTGTRHLQGMSWAQIVPTGHKAKYECEFILKNSQNLQFIHSWFARWVAWSINDEMTGKYTTNIVWFHYKLNENINRSTIKECRTWNKTISHNNLLSLLRRAEFICNLDVQSQVFVMKRRTVAEQLGTIASVWRHGHLNPYANILNIKLLQAVWCSLLACGSLCDVSL